MTIDFNQILPQFLPATQVELDREGGLSGLPRDAKKVLLVGYKTSAGTATAGQVKRITSETQAMADWGEGSMVACMAAALISGRDPFGLSERGRTVYVYLTEALLVMLIMHLRLTMPWLLHLWDSSY